MGASSATGTRPGASAWNTRPASCSIRKRAGEWRQRPLLGRRAEATAVVTGLRNGDRQSLAAVLAEAERDIGENGRGSVTYRRITPDWFVLSGYLADRIYYRRSFLARGGAVIATLWIEIPRALKPCLERAVATMSLSFRPIGP